MADFEVTILGSSSATPTFTRNPSAQVVQLLGRYFLIDCGEGTQIQLRRFRIKFQKINQVFISHLHGDHYLGLMGFLQTLHLLGRTYPLQLYAPEPLKEIIDIQLKYSETTLRYPLEFYAINTLQHIKIWEDNCVEIYTLPLKHRIACAGFLIKEKEKLFSLKKEKIAQYNISVAALKSIKEGNDFIAEDGKIIPNNELVYPKQKPRSYAYCSDTAYLPNDLPSLINGVNLLYHESTFLSSHQQRATETLHSTAQQAAHIAYLSNVKKLLLGHFSARYPRLDDFLSEARVIFPETYLVEEGKTYIVD
jgi:ribonuclease Z